MGLMQSASDVMGIVINNVSNEYVYINFSVIVCM